MIDRKGIICLGIESTAHTFGISLASSRKKILSNINESYKPPYGEGIHPRQAAQHHSDVASKILIRSIQKSDIIANKIDAIAFSAGPGLGPTLRVGATVARVLASWLEKPLVPVHHAIGHIEIANFQKNIKDPLVILVSGGHTTIAAYAAGRWRIFGETEDITLGNLLDVFGRKAKLPSPSGPFIEKLAAKSNRKYISLPYVIKGNDVSYSGLLTAAVTKLTEKNNLEDLCYSLQEVSFAMLAEASERALVHTGKKQILLTGGVAANERLQQIFYEIAIEHDVDFFTVPKEYSGDCGAQIAWTGVLAYKSGIQINIENSFIKPKWRLDHVDCPWRL